MNNLEKFIINPTNEFHVLRHFKYVDSSYKKSLIDKPYWYYDYAQKKFIASTISQVDIENALTTISTKFDKDVVGIETPKKLLEIIRNKFQELLMENKIRWIDNLESKATSFTLDYQFEVGQINCINKDTISEKDRVQIKPALRSKCIGEDAVVVNTVSSIELASTKTIFVQIIETQQLPFYMITAFPDCSLSDNIPDENLVFVV